MTIAPIAGVRLRPIALPAEHGSWGLVVQPIVLGLLIAPSRPGACLAAGAFAAFLARRPFKVALTQWMHGRSGHVRVALGFVLLYGAVALAGLGATILLGGPRPLLPLLLFFPLVIVFLGYDVRNQSRAWQAELAGAVAFASVTAGIAVGAGWGAAPAFALTGVVVARAVPSVLYVRSRVRLDRDRPPGRALVVATHVLALTAVCGLAHAGLLPWLAVAPFLVLLARAVIGLSGYRRRVTIRRIGMTEMGYGVLTVLAIAVGYWTELS